MGIIKAVTGAIGQALADSWQEVFEPNDMGERTVFTDGILVRKGQNVKGTDNTVSNGSVIHVYDNQMMLLVDGGKVVDYTAEPGYYTVSDSSMPSLFSGEFGDSLKEVFNRIKFGGQTPVVQKVYYINLQEIKGIKFGTRNPINYFDSFYNAELFLRAHGTYSVKITNPLQFYVEVVPRNAARVDIEQINEQYLNEFLQALQAAINQMSADGTRISHVTSKALELGKYMANILDEEWSKMRGMEIQAVGLASISYDEESQRLINMRNEGAMLGTDFNVMRGMAVKNITEGIRDAGSNSAGAMNAFMGVGMGLNSMNATLGGLNSLQTPNDMQNMNAMSGMAAGQTPASGWTCACGQNNTGKFCSNCGTPAPAAKKAWTCECGQVNEGKFCTNCGKPAPAASWTCTCGAVNEGKFCSNCGKARG
ncbi:MAG: SPFH domain-containing protein [Roseburia sp.]|nr:SPFH domain-containing protein [Roseburia sp.]